MGLNGAVVSDSWTLVLRRNVSRARDIHLRLRTALFLIFAALVTILVAFEITTSWFEARLFSRIDREATFSLQPGSSPVPEQPAAGPYDRRLGYYDLPGFARRLESGHFQIQAQIGRAHV